MSISDLDTLIDRLLPRVLADRDLGDGRTFTPLHLSHLWALSCLLSEECFDQDVLARRVVVHLPPTVRMAAVLSV